MATVFNGPFGGGVLPVMMGEVVSVSCSSFLDGC